MGAWQDINVFESAPDTTINLSEIFYDVENGSILAYSISENIDALNTEVVDSILTLSFEEGLYDVWW